MSGQTKIEFQCSKVEITDNEIIFVWSDEDIPHYVAQRIDFNDAQTLKHIVASSLASQQKMRDEA